jgi:hypothetical protein
VIDLLRGACHCGAITLTLPFAPETATSCNCSLCRRIGGPWAYFEFGSVHIVGHPGHTADYIQGDKSRGSDTADKTLRTVRCSHCGCVTHWEPLSGQSGVRHGVHLGNFEPQLLASLTIRKFDGANTWKYLDE